MYKEVGHKEYISFVGNLIRNGKYRFENTHNEFHEGYKMCCVDEKTDVVAAYREKIDGVMKNFVWEDE